MKTWKRIALKEVLHFSGGLLVGAGAVWVTSDHLGLEKWSAIAYGIACGTLPALREIRDVAKGQSKKKMVFDLMAWAGGSVTGSFVSWSLVQ